MVEPDRDAAGGEENGDAIADHGGAGMVDLETLAPLEFDREGLEGFAAHQGVEKLLEMISSHICIIAL